jgi:HEAT repeat protein
MAKTNGNTRKTKLLMQLKGFSAAAAGIPRKRLVVLLGALAVAVTAAVVFVPWKKPLQVVSTAVSDAVRKPTLAELQTAVKANPKDARAHLELGYAMWEAKNQVVAIKEFDVALGIDPTLGSQKLADTLTSCFGTWCQQHAGAILGLYKVEKAEPKLLELTKSPLYSVRSTAVFTLEKMGKTEGIDYVGVYAAALATNDCEVKRHAVEKLSNFPQNQRAVTAIRDARAKEAKETPWYAFDCIGGRAEDAEKKILARR